MTPIVKETLAKEELHLFWSHVMKMPTKNPIGEALVEEAQSTDLQERDEDHLTKDLGKKDVFVTCRKFNQGW